MTNSLGLWKVNATLFAGYHLLSFDLSSAVLVWGMVGFGVWST